MAPPQYKQVEVKEGDCISSIAFEYKIKDWHLLYNDQEQKFRNDRKNPNSLNAGDVVRVQVVEKMADTKAAGGVASFTVLKPKPVRLRLVIVDGAGKPYGGKEYSITWRTGLFSGGGMKNGKTDTRGLIDIEIPPNAKDGMLQVDLKPSPSPAAPAPAAAAAAPDPKRYPPLIKPDDFSKTGEEPKKDFMVVWKLAIGSLSSPNTDEGTRQRLHNMGFQVIGGDTVADSVKSYQRRKKVKETGLLADVQKSVGDDHDNP